MNFLKRIYRRLFPDEKPHFAPLGGHTGGGFTRGNINIIASETSTGRSRYIERLQELARSNNFIILTARQPNRNHYPDSYRGDYRSHLDRMTLVGAQDNEDLRKIIRTLGVSPEIIEGAERQSVGKISDDTNKTIMNLKGTFDKGEPKSTTLIKPRKVNNPVEELEL